MRHRLRLGEAARPRGATFLAGARDDHAGLQKKKRPPRWERPGWHPEGARSTQGAVQLFLNSSLALLVLPLRASAFLRLRPRVTRLRARTVSVWLVGDGM